ncbi:unnamed protein product [Rotaria sordida]|uniref:Uncharacterized protein n=1 Tax=Rotaria sordida TaxID=392033 RepID=A0A815I1P1_9BILA|nr:unnamed protein product [Rotaria sordida]
MLTALFGPVKAMVQVICDDTEGAITTMDQFTRTNPFIFPIRVTADLIVDGKDEAYETCKAFGGALDNMANSTPVLGHVKGAITAIAGDERKGEEIMKQATRSTLVVGAGVGGFIGGGPVGAFVFSAEVGTLWDVTRAATGGPANGVAKLVVAMRDDEDLSPGEIFDCVATPVVDGVAGVAAGKMADSLYKNNKKNQERASVQQKNAIKQKQINKLEEKIAKQGVNNPETTVKNMCQDAEELKGKVDQVNTKTSSNRRLNGHTACSMIDEEGNKSTGYSTRLCNELKMDRFAQQTSRLCQEHPNISPVLNRALECCAEHMAYENLPNGNPILTYAVQIHNGIVTCVERCQNCMQFPLGNVITDAIHREWIPSALEFVPAAGSYVGSTINGIIYITLQNGGRPMYRKSFQ